MALEAKALRIIHHGGGTEVAVAVDIMDPATTLAITMVDIMVAVVTTVMAVVVVTTDMDTLITSKTHTIWLPCPRQNKMIKSKQCRKKVANISEYVNVLLERIFSVTLVILVSLLMLCVGTISVFVFEQRSAKMEQSQIENAFP